MRRDLEPAVERLLAEMLAEAEDLLPFARAVVLHLDGAAPGPGDPMRTATVVLEALGWGGEEEAGEVDGGQAEFPLHRHPDLLASFFQNADLLEPASPHARPIARAVMRALERIGPPGAS